MPQNIVIIGASLAGASAAEALRTAGFDGTVSLIGAEAEAPYIRPPLSKQYLSGKDARDTVFVHPLDWYSENRVELRLSTRVARIDRATHTITLAGGGSAPYDKLLIATGSSPRTLTIAGSDFAGVHYLRTLEDSDALRTELASGGRNLVLIGSGWIGMEVAATAKTLGNAVTILERDPIPLANALGAELGQLFADLHVQNGVDLRPSVEVTAILGSHGRVSGVQLASGEVVPADLVLVGVGATPNVQLAADAGLEVDNGILVSASLQSSDPDVFAAGDVANALHPVIGQRLRSEHWANALNSGAIAAKTMLGVNVVYDAIPYFYTDQFDLGMEYSGYAPLTKGAEVVYRGDVARREFIAFWVNGGRVVAGMNVNVWDVNEAVQGIITRANLVDETRLADTSVPLESF